MAGDSLCAVCGNRIDPTAVSCPYCGTERTPQYEGSGGAQIRIINLERGMPRVHEALHRFALELEAATRSNIKALVVIHGYGSSGTGGAIKEALRKRMGMYLEHRVIREVLPGEKAGKRSGSARQVIKRFPVLKKILSRANPGITVVIL